MAPKVQRKTEGAAAPAAVAASGQDGGPLIVEDGAPTQPGQIAKSAYLAQLRDAVTATASGVLGPNWQASSCADLQRIFGHYAALDAAAIERIMKRYARVPTAVSAAEYIAAACARIVAPIARWGGGEELSWDVGGSGVPAAVEEGAAGPAAPAAAAPTAPTGGAVQLKADHAPVGASVDPATDLGVGEALDSNTASRMGGAFGERFDDVRIHTEASAASKTASLGAHAMAMGNHVAFAPGEYQPGTPTGDGLIAHELAHVVQQRGAAPVLQQRAIEVDSSGAHERDADDAADAVVARLHGGAADAGGPVRPALSTRLGVQRGNRPDDKKPGDDKLRPGDRIGRSRVVEVVDVPQIQNVVNVVNVVPQLPPPPPVRAITGRLFELFDLDERDDDYAKKRDANYFTSQCHQTALRVGAPPQPCSMQDEADACLYIIGKMGGGGGSYGEKNREAVPGAVARANQLGYDITNNDVRDGIQSAITLYLGLGGTQIGQFKGEWGGGGFFDFKNK